MKKCWHPKPHAPHINVQCIRPWNHQGYHQACVDGKIVRWFL